MKLQDKLLFLSLFLPLFSTAQIGYYTGYAVTAKGDTLKGYINYKNWENTPREIMFKAEAADEPRKLTVQDIVCFNIDIGSSVEFQKYEGAISMDNTDISYILTTRDSSFKMDTVFLKVIQKGKNVILFSYDDHLKKRFFIANSTDFRPVELIYRIYYNSNSSGSPTGRTVNENTFMKQLYALGQKYNVADETFKNRLQRSAYSEHDLLITTSTINGISEDDPLKTNHEKPILIKLVLSLVALFIIAVPVLATRH